MDFEQELNSIIEEALLRSASDIHIDPFKHSLMIRYRVDGALSPGILKDLLFHEGIISRIKVLARLAIDDRRLPKDGKFRWSSETGLSADIRVSMVPTSCGENAVLRIFRSENDIPTLAELGFNETQQDKLESALQGTGLIIVGGSTGSGKTTTLYSLLSRLNKNALSIVTIEDPIEYSLSGVRQIEVSGTSLLEFKSMLRSVLRQDPDVIMVGEIRDRDTAEIAIHASLTGHLVLSTIHASSRLMIKERFVQMGIPSYLYDNVLRLSLYQTLELRTDEKGRVVNAEMI